MNILLIQLLVYLFLSFQNQSFVLPNSDSALYYNNIANNSENLDTIILLSQKSLDYCTENNYKIKASNYYNLSKSYYLKNKSRESLYYCFKALDNHSLYNSKSDIARDYILIAKCYHDLIVKDSIFYYFNLALDIYTEMHDSLNLSYTYQSIGAVNVDLGFASSALEYYHRALEIDSLIGNYLELMFDYQNIGFVELESGNIENSLSYYTNSVRISDTISTDNPYYIYSKYASYLGLASAFISFAKQNQYQQYADSCLLYINKIGNYFIDNGIYSSQFYLQHYYAQYLMFCKRNTEAIDVLLNSFQYISEDEGVLLFSQYYSLLSEAYENNGDYKNAIYYYKKFHDYAVSLSNDSTMNLIAEFKAEQEVKIQQAENQKLELEKSTLKTIVTLLVVVLSLLALLVFYIVRVLKIKHRTNQKLSSINQKIYSSLTYALKIQNAVLPTQVEIDRLFNQNFVYYRPRDVVSGDFYFVAQCGRYNVLITADCTGHGIPGALLSMLGISALKEFCVTENDAANPGIILDRLRSFVVSTLASNSDTIMTDGMDMTICSFDFESMEMRYAVANQTIIFIRRGNVKKLKGNTLPVGNYVVNEHFTTFIQPIENGDMVYCFSDGITDQLGSEPTDNNHNLAVTTKGKKFSLPALIDFLSNNYYRPLNVQCNLLNKTIDQWRNGRQYIDDITMIGVRI